MRNEGKSDIEIRDALTKQKVSPKDIRDALEHFNIKKAVGNTAGNPEDPFPNQDAQNSDTYTPQPNPPSQGQYGQLPTPPSPPADYNQSGYSQGGYDNQYNQAAPQQDYYQQPYNGGYGYQPGMETGNDTMVEISEQVFEEKSREMSKKIDAFEEFRALSQSKLDRVNERLKKVESIIDRLQAAILERVGSYGRDIGSIKKEMSMMQDTFAKTMKPKKESSEKSKKSASKKS